MKSHILKYILSNRKLLDLIRILLGLLFIVSGLLKIMDLISFQETLTRYQLLPAYLLNFSTILIPSLELITGLFFFLGIFTRAAALIQMILLMVFTFAVTIKYINGDQFDCGCFGSLALLNSISLPKLLFTIFLLLLTSMVFKTASKKIVLIDQLKVTLTYSFTLFLILNMLFSKNEIISTVYADNITNIKFEKATELLSNKDTILFDARDISRYQKEHAARAFPLPYNSFEKYFNKYNFLEKDKFILVYCDGSLCTAADRVAKKIIRRGYRNVFVIKENFRAWKDRTNNK